MVKFRASFWNWMSDSHKVHFRHTSHVFFFDPSSMLAWYLFVCICCRSVVCLGSHWVFFRFQLVKFRLVAQIPALCSKDSKFQYVLLNSYSLKGCQRIICFSRTCFNPRWFPRWNQMIVVGFGHVVPSKHGNSAVVSLFATGTSRLSMDHRPSDPAEARRVREEGERLPSTASFVQRIVKLKNSWWFGWHDWDLFDNSSQLNSTQHIILKTAWWIEMIYQWLMYCEMVWKHELPLLHWVRPKKCEHPARHGCALVWSTYDNHECLPLQFWDRPMRVTVDKDSTGMVFFSNVR